MGGMPRGKVSLASGRCNTTSPISSYMHTCKERRSKARIIIAIERAFGSVTLPDDADGGPRHLRYPQGSLAWSKKKRGMK